MHFHGECGGFLGAVAQAEGGQHVAFGGGAYAGAAALQGLVAYLFPELVFGVLDFVVLGVGFYLGDDHVDFLHFQVDDVVHDALRVAHVAAVEVEVEFGLGVKGCFT